MNTKLSISVVSLAFALVFGACSSQPPALIKGDDVAACTPAATGTGDGTGAASEKKTDEKKAKKKKKSSDEDEGAGLALAGGSGYLGKLQDVIKDKCVSCHGSGGTEPELTSYETVLAAKKAVMAAIADESMPQGGKLDQEERTAFFDWKKNDYAEGKAGDDDDAKKAPAKKKKKAAGDDDDAAKPGSGC